MALAYMYGDLAISTSILLFRLYRVRPSSITFSSSPSLNHAQRLLHVQDSSQQPVSIHVKTITQPQPQAVQQSPTSTAPPAVSISAAPVSPLVSTTPIPQYQYIYLHQITTVQTQQVQKQHVKDKVLRIEGAKNDQEFSGAFPRFGLDLRTTQLQTQANPNNADSILRIMVTVHPDDEVFFGGALLTTTKNWMVICVTCCEGRIELGDQTMNKADKDKSGSISRAELDAFNLAHGGSGLLHTLDRDYDGRLSRAEFNAYIASLSEASAKRHNEFLAVMKDVGAQSKSLCFTDGWHYFTKEEQDRLTLTLKNIIQPLTRQSREHSQRLKSSQPTQNPILIVSHGPTVKYVCFGG